MTQHHKSLNVAQTCDCCGAIVNLHGAFTSRWNGHKNIFFHPHCFDAMMNGDALGSMGEQIHFVQEQLPFGLHEDNGN